VDSVLVAKALSTWVDWLNWFVVTVPGCGAETGTSNLGFFREQTNLSGRSQNSWTTSRSWVKALTSLTLPKKWKWWLTKGWYWRRAPHCVTIGPLKWALDLPPRVTPTPGKRVSPRWSVWTVAIAPTIYVSRRWRHPWASHFPAFSLRRGGFQHSGMKYSQLLIYD
jgi:hypothetical protein